ncbi:radical SAM protein [Chloroflexota bacterium]
MSRNSIKDARYRLSRETGTITKDWGGRLPIALIYPNSYYIGMSSLGIHAIYSLLNGYQNVVCERFFLEKEDKAPLLSLESRRSLPDFSVLAFSISYELDYFNVVKILKESGIPLYAADRDERHPLVIAGGPCITANPMPLLPFFDCLCIGEAEVILPQMLTVINDEANKRFETIKRLASLPGVYAPQVDNDAPVTRQWVNDTDAFPTHSIIMTPDTELGDLYLIEVERGCGHGCRFCMVSNTFSPVRFRSIDNLVAQAEEGLKYRKRIGLVGPAVSDHPQFEELLSRLQQMGAELSVSSLRIRPLSLKALEEVARGKTKSIALAPEAGSQRLRDIIKKGISEGDIDKAIEMVAKQSIKQLRLYFMIGLPTETDADIREIIDLSLNCKGILDRQNPGCRITLSIASFVPKAGTPFQWLPMEELATLNRRLSMLKKQLTPLGIQVKAESPAWSRVQGALARGDTGLSEVLANIEDISLSGWRKAVEKYGIDTDSYLSRRLDTSENLPWSVIDSGAKPGHLEAEMHIAMKA